MDRRTIEMRMQRGETHHDEPKEEEHRRDAIHGVAE